MQAADQIISEWFSLSSPILNPQERLPIIADFTHIPLPALDGEVLFLNDLLGLFQGQAVAFDTRGKMRGANTHPLA